jgi:multisubunit Na+/H+ antiporter MnhE subunit
MPKLIRLYITQVIWGFVISAVFVGVLLAVNVANLRGLIWGSDVGLIALVMIWFMNGIVFAGVQFAYKIMSMAEKPGGPRRGTPVAAELARATLKVDR